MISALVINVKSAVERREFQLEQLDKLGISVEVLEATSLSIPEANAYSEGMKKWQRPIRHTEVAAMDSHKRAWQKVVDLGKPQLILEDDAVLAPQTTKLLALLETTLDERKIECLTLEVRARRKWLRTRPTSSLKLNDKDTINFYELVQDRSGLAAYILTPKGAAKLLDYNKNRLGLADALVWGTYNLKAVQAVPALATQADRMDFYGLKSPIDVASTINAGQAHQKSNWMDRARRLKGQIRQSIRVLRYSFRCARAHVPLIKF